VRLDFRLSAAAAVLLAGAGSTAAYATDGYFMNGYGASQTALAGAGVAYSQDAMAISLNPAGLVNVDDQTVAGMAVFMPFRSYTAGIGQATLAPPYGFGPAGGPVDPGTHNSGNNWFPVPDFAWTKHLGQDTVLGVGVYGNGGMDTRYTNAVFMGVSGPTGVDVNQAFMSVSLSQRFGQLSVGVAPVLAMQVFNARGLGGFSGMSSSQSNLTGGAADFSFSYGGGIRAGVEYDVTPALRIAAAGTSRMYMTNFETYKGLFAGGGSFDIPATVTAGISYDVRPNITLMADYKHIFYSDVASIANPSPQNPMTDPLLGSSNGPGFGWHDINVYKFGVNWRYNPLWTFRAGYSYNDSPLDKRDIMMHILAPATVQHHITGGLKYRWSDNMDVEFSAMYAPEKSISGNAPAMFGGQPIEVRMYEVEALAGIVYHWNGRRDLEPLK
jgi:long-chain fatty acid transport protein